MAKRTRLLVVCEKCGKEYKIDPSKLTEPETNIRCAECDSLIKVIKPKTEKPLPPVEESAPAAPEAKDAASEPDPGPVPEEKPARKRAAPAPEPSTGKTRIWGLRGRMFVLFLVIPIVLMMLAGAFYLWQLQQMERVFTQSSTQIVERLSSELMAESSRMVAKDVQTYFADQNHRLMNKEDLLRDFEFKMAGVQKVGMTGNTFVYAKPGEDGVWLIWAHANPKVVGKDIDVLKGQFKEGFSDFKKIITGVESGSTSAGHYEWTDSNNVKQKRFIVCTPVEGTNYVVVVSKPAAEFVRDVKRLQTRTDKVATQTRNAILIILGFTIVLIGAIVGVTSARLTKRIRTLTEATDSISTGDMETEIEVDSNDELGDLAEAISRMQESIRLFLERAKRRRRR